MDAQAREREASLFEECAMEIQREWKMGGLAGTLYEDFALEVHRRYEEKRQPSDDRTEPNGENDANAALIAAGPALLSALRACFEVLDCNWTATNGQGISDEENGARHMALAAIRTATGAGNGGDA